MYNIKFSVVIPAYNAEKFIISSLEYVRLQTYPNFEILVTNNGSTDKTLALLEEYKLQHPTIDLTITSQDNMGISESRNTGIKKATGQYICFLDADDCWYPNKLDRMAYYIERYPNADVLWHYEIHRSSDRVRTVKYRSISIPAYEDLLFHGNCLSGSATTVRTGTAKKIGGFDPRYTSGEEDYDFWMRLARDNAVFKLIPETLGEYLICDTSTSASVTGYFMAVFEMQCDHFNYLEQIRKYPQKKLTQKKRRCKAQMYYMQGRRFYMQHNREASIEVLQQSLKLNPFYLKAYAAYVLSHFK